MSSHEKTLKLVPNLDRGSVEGRLAEVQSAERRSPARVDVHRIEACLAAAQMTTRLKDAINVSSTSPTIMVGSRSSR